MTLPRHKASSHFAQAIRAALGRGIGLRLLIAIALFSSVVTVMSSAFELYFDYRGEIQDIRDRFFEIEHSYVGSLGGSLWSLDEDQIRRQIIGIKRLPDIQFVSVEEVGRDVQRALKVTVGSPSDGPHLDYDVDINYADGQDSATRLGVLHVEATLAGVYSRLVDKAIIILISQGVKTFLVSMFILYIVHRLVTRHLMSIARYVGTFNLSASPPLALNRRNPSRPDEFDGVAAAFNSMSDGLRELYRELHEVNAELEEDIAARRKAEEEVTRLNAELEQRVRRRTAELEASNKELDSFTYSVSHDLRAPLRRIEGFGQILVTEYVDRLDDRFRHYLERIRAGARDMGEMIDSFLQLSRSTRSQLSIQPVDLSQMAAHAVAKLREKEPDRQVAITIEPGLTTEGDPKLLESVLENLLGNAWKYSRKAERAEISFGREEVNGKVNYLVKDNGAGFDMAYLDRLFAPFSRLHRAEEFEGTGIGLATVVRILARHGGRIWAEGAVGQGASFRFTLWDEPVAPEPPPQDGGQRHE
jgi:signal transduction histidine kinase